MRGLLVIFPVIAVSRGCYPFGKSGTVQLLGMSVGMNRGDQ